MTTLRRRHRVRAVRRLVVLAAVATLAVAALSADAATPGFQYGVAAGEITPTSVVLWTRAARAGSVGVNLGTTAGSLELRGSARATQTADLTVHVKVDRLRPATTYSYVFIQGGTTSTVGTFTTAPSSAAARAVRVQRRRRRDGRAERQAGLQPVRGLRSHVARGQRLQHQPWRHDLLGQRDRRRSPGSYGRGEVGEVQARTRPACSP